MPKVSIIIPVYGVEDYIKKCIESVVNQTFKDIEIIVVDDGTKDKSIDIIKKEFFDKRLKIYSKPNGGLSDARNYGLKYAHGEYVMYLDSDDYVSETIIEKMYQNAIENNSDIVVSLANKIVDNQISPLEYPINQDLDNVRRYILNRPSACGKLIKKEIMEHDELKFPKRRIYEDIAVIPALALYTDKISFVDEYLYYYLVRDGSITNQKKYKKNMEDIFFCMDNLSSLFAANKTGDKYFTELEYIYINHLLHTAMIFFLPFAEGRDSILRISDVMHERYPKWYKNKYYQKRNIKYKIVCWLVYWKKIDLVKILLRKYLSNFK